MLDEDIGTVDAVGDVVVLVVGDCVLDVVDEVAKGGGAAAVGVVKLPLHA